MTSSTKALSDITIFSKYAKHIKKLKRRESYIEIMNRNRSMHKKKFKDSKEILEMIDHYYDNFVMNKLFLPSLRSAQFAGKAIEVNPSRMYGCSYLPIDHYKAFSEIMFLLLGGTGTGYSVQFHHIEELPPIIKPKRKRRFLVNDSIEGWADAIKALMESYMCGKSLPVFDFQSIRPKGAPLKTAGGKAPGPEPLKTCLHRVKTILDRKEINDQLAPIEAHDIICHIADCVMAGGIRRASCIAFFSLDDYSMMTSKFGNWYELNPQRGRANNSVVLLRHRVKRKDFYELWEKIKESGTGEPGFVFTNDYNRLYNPCCFTGDTPLKAENGFSNFKDLAGKGIVKLYNKNNELVNGKVWSTGVKDIVKVSLRSKEAIRCTQDHVFMLNDGTESEAKNLNGKRLMPCINLNTDQDYLYTKLGFIQGDGGLGRLKSKDHKGLEINIGQKDIDVADFFKIEYLQGKVRYYTVGYNEICKKLQFSDAQLPERTMPKTYPTWDQDKKAGFIKGMYSANGSIITTTRVAYKSTCKQLIEELKDTLIRDFDIDSYITTNKPKMVKFENGDYLCKESYDLNITRFSEVVKFAEQINFIHIYKKEKLDRMILEKSPMVSSVKPCGQEEVFDFSLYDDTHWGVISGGTNSYAVHNCEASLYPHSFCNLAEIHGGNIESQKDLNERAAGAATIATLQATYTDFHYLRDIWKKNTEKSALIGVSFTGIASGTLLKYNLKEAAEIVVETNIRVAKMLGINPSERCCVGKPSGTGSQVLETSSGVSAWHSEYYLRRMRQGKDEAVYKYLKRKLPELVEDEFFKPKEQAVIGFPVKAPEGAILRTESAINMLERIKKLHQEWILPGHVSGANTHNISATINIREDEWDIVRDWMWKNKEYYNGLSVIPYDLGNYKQTPFEEITKKEYDRLMKFVKQIDLTEIVEDDDDTDFTGEVACGGGACLI